MTRSVGMVLEIPDRAYLRLGIRGKLEKLLRFMIFRYLWLAPLLVSLVLSIALLERKYGLTRQSFLAASAMTISQLVELCAAITLVDVTVLYTLMCGWLWVCSLAGIKRPLGDSIFVGGALSGVLIANVMTFNLITYLGDLVRLRASLQIADGWAGTLPYVMDYLSSHWAIFAVFAVGLAVIWCWLWRFAARLPDRRSTSKRWRLLPLFVLWSLSGGMEFCFCRSGMGNPVGVHLRRTTLHRVFAACLAGLTDFDRDGHGWIDTPPDLSPFDRARHPFARDLPGNGIDEDDLGGDLPALMPRHQPQCPVLRVSSPDVIVIVECSFRPDVIWGGSAGSGVMPTLEMIAERGFHHPAAFSHSGFTTSSLKEILSGELTGHSQSLIKDFKAMGYRVGAILAQSGQFGSVANDCALDKADFYFDAEQDPSARATTYTAPSSMSLPMRRLLPEVGRFLNDTNPNQPYFLFLFVASLHFPYGLDSPQSLIECRHLAAHEIGPERRNDVVSLYRNAAANLDRWIAGVLKLVKDARERQKRGAPVIVVTGDHGESIFDDGTLGHGIIINDVQTQVPLVISDGWGVVPTPFGHVDLRPFLLNLVTTQRPEHPAVTLRAAEAPVLQYCGAFDSPLQIAHVTSRGRVIVDLDVHTFICRGSALDLKKCEGNSDFLSLVRDWESLRLKNTASR